MRCVQEIGLGGGVFRNIPRAVENRIREMCPCVEPGGRARAWRWRPWRREAAGFGRRRRADVPAVSGGAVPATGGRLT
jgi:hypothetical protein